MKRSSHRQLVLDYVISRGIEGATDFEICTALGITGNSERPRRKSLYEEGLIGESGEKRRSPSGHMARVWVGTQFLPEDKKPKTTKKPEGELQGKGVALANEAIGCLMRIPKNDGLRERGFQIVKDWIRRNK